MDGRIRNRAPRPDDRRVVVGSTGSLSNGLRVDDEHRLGVERHASWPTLRDSSTPSVDDFCSAQVVGAFQRRDHVEADRVAVGRLLHHALLPEDLDGPVAGAVHADLRAGQQAVAQLEADLRAGVEAEEVAQQVAEVAASERPREPVRHAERGLVLRHPQRCRQRREREVGLQRIERLSGFDVTATVTAGCGAWAAAGPAPALTRDATQQQRTHAPQTAFERIFIDGRLWQGGCPRLAAGKCEEDRRFRYGRG